MENYRETKTQVVELVTHSPQTQDKDDIHELYEEDKEMKWNSNRSFPGTDSASTGV